MIATFTFKDATACRSLLRSCYDEKLYMDSGLFNRLYRHPERYFIGENKVVIEFRDGRPVAIMFVAKDFYHFYKSRVDRLCYGMISAYTRPEMRRQGIAKSLLVRLFDDNPGVAFGMMNNVHRLLPLCYYRRAVCVLDETPVLLAAKSPAMAKSMAGLARVG